MENLEVPKLELFSCLCEPDRAKQSPTLQEFASAEERRLATTSSSIISDLGASENLFTHPWDEELCQFFQYDVE